MNYYEFYFYYYYSYQAQNAVNNLIDIACKKKILTFNDICDACGGDISCGNEDSYAYIMSKWSSDDILAISNPVQINPHLWHVKIPLQLNALRLKALKEEENKMKENLFQKGTMIEKMKQAVVDYFNGRCDRTDNKKLTMDEVYIVWFSKTLQNAKALISTTVSDGMYYELTYNGDKNEMYLDAYKKWENKCIKMED